MEPKLTIQQLAKKYPLLTEDRYVRHVKILERMVNFYESRAPSSHDGGALFNSFVMSLNYALETMSTYRKLTSKLIELAEGEEDDTTTSKTN